MAVLYQSSLVGDSRAPGGVKMPSTIQDASVTAHCHMLEPMAHRPLHCFGDRTKDSTACKSKSTSFAVCTGRAPDGCAERDTRRAQPYYSSFLGLCT